MLFDQRTCLYIPTSNGPLLCDTAVYADACDEVQVNRLDDGQANYPPLSLLYNECGCSSAPSPCETCTAYFAANPHLL